MLSGRIALQGADDAGTGKAAMHLDAELGKPLRDEFGGPMLLERGLGMRMNIVPPRCEIGLEIRDPINDGHGVDCSA